MFFDVAVPAGFLTTQTPARVLIRKNYAALGHSATRAKLKIDSAGGHGTVRGHGNFDDLAAMVLADFNIELAQ
jgi:hypothetical protein